MIMSNIHNQITCMSKFTVNIDTCLFTLTFVQKLV